MALVSELISLQYEKAENTGIIKIRETARGLKDRYTSVSYGCYFVGQLARDLLNQPEELSISQATICVSAL